MPAPTIRPIALCLAILLYLSALATSAQESAVRQPLVGRVETYAGGAEPALPAELLGLTRSKDPFTLQVERSGQLPEALSGEWYGNVKLTQMATYPELHTEPYCREFIREIDQSFHLDEKGQITFRFQKQPDGSLAVASTDVWFPRGLKVQLTAEEGPALVPGGTNVPHPIRNEVKPLGPNRVEQTRIDLVTIVDKERRTTVHNGFTEVSALYQIIGPRLMQVKILNVDYDQDGKPLWKALMEGQVRHWSSR